MIEILFCFVFFKDLEEIFDKHLENVKHCLTSEHVSELATMCVGRTGDDIRRIMENVKDAPTEKIRRASYFRRQPTPLLCNNPLCGLWHVTNKETEGAQRIDWQEFQSVKYICKPSITFDDILKEVEKQIPSVSPETLNEYVELGNSLKFVVDEPLATTN